MFFLFDDPHLRLRSGNRAQAGSGSSKTPVRGGEEASRSMPQASKPARAMPKSSQVEAGPASILHFPRPHFRTAHGGAGHCGDAE